MKYAIGDSITYGNGSSNNHRSWSDILSDLYGFMKYKKLAKNGAFSIIESQEVFGFDRDNGEWDYYFNDYCHPNDNGYNQIALYMLDKIRELAH